MSNYYHLPLPFVVSGSPKFHPGSKSSEQTQLNRESRVKHGTLLKKRTSELSKFWKTKQEDRIKRKLPIFKCGIPLLLEIDPNANIEFLRGLGFEIISELENGYIIVATNDVDFAKLIEKVDKFIAKYNEKSDSPANIYGMKDDSERIKEILSKDLFENWSSIQDSSLYTVDVGMQCSGNIVLPKYPYKDQDESDEQFTVKLSKWEAKFNEKYAKWDEIKLERESMITELVKSYDGVIISIIDDKCVFSELPDSFSVRLQISGKCLRDLAENLSFVFEISLPAIISEDYINNNLIGNNEDLMILAPSLDAPIVCVIDSGIQEKHKYLEKAIKVDDSICFLKGTSDTSDYVRNGGHGTRVAGAILFPNSIPLGTEYNLASWIRNIRVLDDNNGMPQYLDPPLIVKEVVKLFKVDSHNKTKIFNQSVSDSSPCSIKHMSAWAAEIDYQSYENDVLFIQAIGNLKESFIREQLHAGNEYPNYFNHDECRICDPSQSLQAISVGSINKSSFETDDLISIGDKDKPSAFTRSGPGIWDSIKPDVVEFGGSFVKNKDRNLLTLTNPPEVCPELIRTSPEGPSYSKECIGTSFSAPKVTYIASQLQKLFPSSPALLYRALICQASHWPEWTKNLATTEYVSILRLIGYGIPDINKAIENNEYRITLITENECTIGTREAHLYKIPLPQELREIGEDTEILIEVTLSYAAKPRRTRRTVKRYLSTWLEWESSNIGEDFETFKQRILVEGHQIDDEGGFKWTIGSAVNRGLTDNFSRRNGTLQKDWTIVKSNQLRDAFCIAVRGHEGWGAAFKAKYSIVVSFEAINQDIAIYEPIKSAIEISLKNIEQEIEISI